MCSIGSPTFSLTFEALATATASTAQLRATLHAAELEALIRVEMQRLCPIPYGTMFSVHPDSGTWRVVIVRGGSDDDDFFHIIHLVARRLRTEFDLEG